MNEQDTSTILDTLEEQAEEPTPNTPDYYLVIVTAPAALDTPEYVTRTKVDGEAEAWLLCASATHAGFEARAERIRIPACRG